MPDLEYRVLTPTLITVSAFTKAISHRWTYVQRTVPNIADLFEPVEKAIRDTLIPAIVGRKVNDIERKIFELPVKLGGLGLYNPTKTADTEFNASTRITADLTRIICRQEKDLTNYDSEAVTQIIETVRAEKAENHRAALQDDYDLVNEKMKRIIQLSQEKGADSWLTTPTPTQSV